MTSKNPCPFCSVEGNECHEWNVELTHDEVLVKRETPPLIDEHEPIYIMELYENILYLDECTKCGASTAYVPRHLFYSFADLCLSYPPMMYRVTF
jgi:hypothetical protein